MFSYGTGLISFLVRELRRVGVPRHTRAIKNGVAGTTRDPSSTVAAHRSPMLRVVTLMRPLIAALTVAALVACQPSARPLPTADPVVTAALRSVTEEYFQLRREANLRGNADLLHRRFSALASAEDPARGINVEAWEIRRLTPVSRLDFDLEYYEPIRMFVHEGEVEVIVRGLFTSDRRGSGEFKLSLYFAKRDGAWELLRSDEVTLPEYHEQTPPSRTFRTEVFLEERAYAAGASSRSGNFDPHRSSSDSRLRLEV